MPDYFKGFRPTNIGRIGCYVYILGLDLDWNIAFDTRGNQFDLFLLGYDSGAGNSRILHSLASTSVTAVKTPS